MHGLKTYFHYMEDPAAALKEWVQARSLAWACAGYLAAALGWVLFFNIGDGISVAAFVGKWAVVFAAELTAGFFMAAVCGMFLDFCRVKASPAELFSLVGSAGFIKGLFIVFALWNAMWPQARLGGLAAAAVLLVLGLQLGYLTRGLMRLYGVSAWKALGAWLFGFIPLCAAGLLGCIFAAWGLMLLF